MHGGNMVWALVCLLMERLNLHLIPFKAISCILPPSTNHLTASFTCWKFLMHRTIIGSLLVIWTLACLWITLTSFGVPPQDFARYSIDKEPCGQFNQILLKIIGNFLYKWHEFLGDVPLLIASRAFSYISSHVKVVWGPLLLLCLIFVLPFSSV